MKKINRRQKYPAAFPRARVLASHIQARYGIEAWLPLEVTPVGDGEIEALPNAHKTYNDTFDWASSGSEKIESSKKKKPRSGSGGRRSYCRCCRFVASGQQFLEGTFSSTDRAQGIIDRM